MIQNNNNIYRGYSYDEEIYPNIIRIKDLSMYEEDFLTQFERYGLAYFSANNAMEFLSTAQHYGLPTRLVDFTYNPYIALFFALYNEKNDVDDQYYKIIYCDVKNCVLFDNEKNPSRVDICKAKSKNEHFLESEYSKRKSYTKELIRNKKVTVNDANEGIEAAAKKYLGKEVLLTGALAAFCSQSLIGLFIFNRTINGTALLSFMFLGCLILANAVTLKSRT